MEDQPEAQEKGENERPDELNHYALISKFHVSLKGRSVTYGDNKAVRRGTCSGGVKLSPGVKLRKPTSTERAGKVFSLCL